jgi:hypothetical protein
MFRLCAPTKALFDKAWTLPEGRLALIMEKRTISIAAQPNPHRLSARQVMSSN